MKEHMRSNAPSHAHTGVEDHITAADPRLAHSWLHACTRTRTLIAQISVSSVLLDPVCVDSVGLKAATHLGETRAGECVAVCWECVAKHNEE